MAVGVVPAQPAPLAASAAGQGLECLARQLYGVLTDGFDGPLRWNIRHGCSLRDAATRRPILGSHTDEWRPARDLHPDGSESDRVANPFILLQHLRGRCDVAIQAPSWSSLIVLDIDRSLPPPRRGEEPFELELRACLRRDDVLAAVWRAYGFSAERQPVILRTPGGGYHVYLPLNKLWPLAWSRQWHEHHLRQNGLELAPGVLELYPSGVPLRAPCGRGSAVLVPKRPDDPDHLELTEVGTRMRKGRVVRDVLATAAAFLERIQEARKPLEEWLGEQPEAPIDPAWDATWGPFGARKKTGPQPRGRGALNQHKVEVQRGEGSALPLPSGSSSLSPSPPSQTAPRRSGHLLYGRAFREKITSLSLHGIPASRERHDDALKMTWYHHVVRRAGREETLREVEQWLRSRSHSVKPGREARWIRTTMREVTHYLDRLLRTGSRHPPAAGGVAQPRIGRLELTDADETLIQAAMPSPLAGAARAILTYLGTFADDRGRVPHAVDLSSRTLEGICGQGRVADAAGGRRRASAVALEALAARGLLAVHTDYSVGRHARRYTVWYEFGSGRLPEETESGFVVGRREVDEGELVAVIEQPGLPPVGRLRSVRSTVADAANAWWRRMYARRAFTPAEFFDADQRRVLPGPFRDRRDRRAGARRQVAAAGVPPPSTPASRADLSPPPLGASSPAPWERIASDELRDRVSTMVAGIRGSFASAVRAWEQAQGEGARSNTSPEHAMPERTTPRAKSPGR